MEWLKEAPIAHRGLYGNGAAENSMTAFRLAVEKGYGMEIDVHLTKDGKLAVFHDSTLRRVCGRRGRVAGLKSTQLADYKLCGTEDGIPLLSELLDYVRGRVAILIEVKPTLIHRPVCRALYETLKDYEGNYAIQSFSPAVVKYFEKFHPEVVRGILAFNFPRSFLKGLIGHYLRGCHTLNTHPHFIAFKVNHLPVKNITRERANGVPIVTWTVNTPKLLEIARKHADNIIFEQSAFPDVDTVTFTPYKDD